MRERRPLADVGRVGLLGGVLVACLATSAPPPRPPRPFLAWTLERPTVHAGCLRRAAMGDRLFLPRGLLAPDQALGVVLGWSALRVLEDDGEQRKVTTGSLHARAQAMGSFYGAGAGWSWDPRTGEHGPEVSLWALCYDLRMLVSTDGDIETMLGVQLKWPVAWVWGR